MGDFNRKLEDAAKAAAVGGMAGAKIGGSVTSAVCGMSGTIVGPVGTFFGSAIGGGTGAAVGGSIGAITGFFGSLFYD